MASTKTWLWIVLGVVASFVLGLCAHGGGKAVVRSNGAAFINIVMRVDQPPFSDNRVRLALKYVVDRPEMRRLTFTSPRCQNPNRLLH